MISVRKWRLPTVAELHEVFDHETGEPKIKGFKKDCYWSYATIARNLGGFWVVFMDRGSEDGYSKTGFGYARCAKRKKNGKLKWSKSSKRTMTWREANKYCEEMNGKANPN
jgi:hypothetical protein